MTLVITACTNRKRVAAPKALSASGLETGTLAQVSRAWIARLRAASPAVPARELYCGRSFSEALNAAEAVDADLAIVSAGLGLLTADTEVPSYGLTVSPRTKDSVLDRVSFPASPRDWWSRIARQSPFSENLEEHITASSGVVVVALPETYLDMIADDLADLADGARRRLRIVTGGPPERLHAKLRPWLMPYDERFDGPQSPLPGTRGDFASRAARHFAETIVAAAPRATAKRHAEAVRNLLDQWAQPARPQRERKSDPELLSILRDLWDLGEGRTTRLLRLVRDQAGVACEQSRFSRLAHQVRLEMSPA
jgi:hypothetical protein